MLTPSQSLYSKIKEWEGCAQSTSDTCKGDVATLGWGHTRGVRPGQKTNPTQAEVWLREDIAYATKVVNDNVKVLLSQSQFDALVDFVFNEGETQFKSSTLLKKINLNNFGEADKEFKKWVYFQGEKLPGLVKRRRWEEDLFLLPF